MSAKRVYLREMSVALDRSYATIRSWERDGRLPKILRPKRDERGWRYWSESQVERVREWMIRERMYPASGLRNSRTPSETAVKKQLRRLRAPRPQTRGD